MTNRLIGIAAALFLAASASIHAGADAPDVQSPAVPDDLVIKLERTACFGTCPVYTVTIDARGNVTYDGTSFVRVQGRQTDRIPVASVGKILETAARIGFFGLKDEYSALVSDLPSTFITITRDGRTKRIEDYFGAPDGLKELERQIDDAARTNRWI